MQMGTSEDVNGMWCAFGWIRLLIGMLIREKKFSSVVGKALFSLGPGATCKARQKLLLTSNLPPPLPPKRVY